MKARFTRLTLLTAALAFAACTGQNDAFVDANDSAAQDAVKGGADVQSALSALPNAQIISVNKKGTPNFVRGDLGKFSLDGTRMRADQGRSDMETIANGFRINANDLSIVRVEKDELGLTHVHYAQTKNGLPVVGGGMSIHVNAKGTIYAAVSAGQDGNDLSATPLVEASSAALKAKGEEKGSKLTYIIDGETENMSLAWQVERSGTKADGTPFRDLVFVNARNGEVVAVHPTIHSALNREVHNLNHGTSTPGPIARVEGGAPVADAIVNTNYDLLGNVWTYYKNVHGRDSFDNAGAKLISSVHYSNNYVNAYWDSTQMVYGDGDGVNASSLAASLDVTGHELTHAVTERTANLTYSGQSGGLNEATSDILGNSLEAYTQGAVSWKTWTVGDDCWTPATPNDGLRYMNDPKRDGTSLDWYPDFTSGVDVHYSSGIANLAYYLMSQGGTHPRGKSSNVVTGIGINKAEKIWYRALTVYWNASTTFAAARTGTMQAAADLYGAGGAEVNSVDQAWQAVGVGITVPPPVTTPLTNGVALTGQGASSGTNKYYKLTVPAGQSTLVFEQSGGTGDADMYVNFGAAPDASTYLCRPYVSGNAETCSFTSPAAGDWYVMINAYSTYSGVSIKGTYGTTTGGDPYLTNGVAKTGIAGAASSAQYWRLAVPAGRPNVVFTISGGTGDADMYTRSGARPTTTTYTCRPYLSGNAETCTHTSPVAGDWYVMIRGYTAFSGVSLKGTY